eukprot:CAMPEP_0178970024 /NCGR_PEP_ID=MMETSP0789-20121207/19248_1 /TAXON_ID=3005 /ORGANISM="Rhizosolenia setigera, Strain CCMP 1694" /LENGTH=405 /DNA_ID=CAMNT_0020656355 /DNA_START=204 /DNA_END=1421 /DNA_ORIENTATION=+
MESFIGLSDLDKHASRTNDVWGWTDHENGGIEYAIIGLDTGTAFVRIDDPINPEVVGFLRGHTGSGPSIWRDMKTYKDHVYIVAEAFFHGLQIFDMKSLSMLDGVPFSDPTSIEETPSLGGSSSSKPNQLEATNHIDTFHSAHNLAVNEDSATLYVTGANSCPGLLIFDLANATNPEEIGCYNDQWYTHDAQCVTYNEGPDADYHGKEICFAFNEDSVDILDVTNKTDIILISHFTYPNIGYTHQGWLNDDKTILFIDDEMDEYVNLVPKTRTIIADVTDLDNPVLLGEHKGRRRAVDHNLYVKDDFVYQSNYRAGLRILDSSSFKSEKKIGCRLREVSFFDLFIDSASIFSGSWSNYPFYDSGVVAMSSIEYGLFILKPKLSNEPKLLANLIASVLKIELLTLT